MSTTCDIGRVGSRLEKCIHSIGLIISLVNEQWYRGRVVPQGQMYPLDRSGLFPSNYVEKRFVIAEPKNDKMQAEFSISLPSKSRPYYPTSPPPIGPQAVIHYQAPYIQQPYHDQMPQMMHGQAYTVTSPPQAPSGLTSMDQQQDDRKKKYGKLGGQVGLWMLMLDMLRNSLLLNALTIVADCGDQWSRIWLWSCSRRGSCEQE